MVITLTSTSAKIQNKIFVEEDFTFFSTKITKIIQDANRVSLSGQFLKIYQSDGTILTLAPQNGLLTLNGESLFNSSISGYKVSVSDSSNPQQVTIEFTIGRDIGNPRMESSTYFKKIITVNKTY